MEERESTQADQSEIESEMAMVPRALRIATEAHAGQTDLAGEPYIWHPLRVMRGVDDLADDHTLSSTEKTNYLIRSVALLHDTLEDTTWTFQTLIGKGISEVVASRVEVLTHRTRPYEEYIDRIAESGTIPILVKIADLNDNLRLSRIPEIYESDLKRARKYRDALLTLSEAYDPYP